MSTLQITTCPTCGSLEIKRVCGPWSGEFQGQSYTIPLLEYYECTACGEKVYDQKAMRQIEDYSPAFRKAHIDH